MRPTVQFSAAILLLCLVAATGCTFYSAPRIEVTEARLTERSADGLVVGFTLAASNPNRDQLPLRSIDYTLWLGGERVFSGSRSPEATLARLAIQELHLPAAVALGPDSPAYEGLVPYRIEGTLTYITPGPLAAVLYDSGIPPPTKSFRHEGEVEIAALGAGAR
jgi:hypothetical protein